jgi:anti-sigma regulatory factor (Ser/Thr protein kinase)
VAGSHPSTTTRELHTVTGPESPWPPSARGYRHDAFLFDSAEQLADVAAPFVLEGLAAGEAAVVATSPATAAIIRDAVDGHPQVHVLERSEVYRARTPSAIQTFRRLAEQHASTGVDRVRVVGEPNFGATPRDWLEWQRYESVVNEALAGWPLWGLCVFDTTRLPDPALESALQTHTAVVTATGRRHNPAFVEPADYLRSLPVPDEPLERTAPRLAADDVTDFIGLRRAVAAELSTVPAPDDLRDDFLLAVDEMTSNALRHGGAPVSLLLWADDDRMVCTIADRGPGWDDPFAGYGPAHGDDLSRGGMGLWLARQLCDHVDIDQDDDGVRVRLTTRLP